eukprot:gene34558-44325_t
MADQTSHEPTMEEILASIRRIISEDDAPEDAAAEPAAEEADDSAVTAAAEPASEAEDDDVLDLTETVDAPTASVSIGDIDAFDVEPEPEPAPAPAPRAAAKAAPKGDALVSPHTESFAASSFGSLTSALLVPHSDRTLEDVTRDLLRPLLQACLDENLPTIVENQ